MLLPILGVFCFTLLATWWLTRAGHRWTTVDEPNHRSLHAAKIPKGGGLAIVGALLLVELLQRLRGLDFFPNTPSLLGFLAIAWVSFLDDRKPVPSGIRLLVHLLAATLLVGGGLQLENLPLPGLRDHPFALGWLAWPISLMFTVWFTNLYNFMDGMDGFAGGMTVLGFGGCAFLSWAQGDPSLALLCALAAAAGGGFLCWNFPPARIFMGDVAAAPLGYLVALVCFLGVQHKSLHLWQTLLIFAPFWVDATATLLRRLLQGERVWEAHRTHAYQRFAQAGWGHRRTTLAEYALMSLCIAAAWAFGQLQPVGQLLLLVTMTALFFLIWLVLRAVEKTHALSGKK